MGFLARVCTCFFDAARSSKIGEHCSSVSGACGGVGGRDQVGLSPKLGFRPHRARRRLVNNVEKRGDLV